MITSSVGSGTESAVPIPKANVLLNDPTLNLLGIAILAGFSFEHTLGLHDGHVGGRPAM